MATFITRMDPGPGEGPLLAVKDLVDVAGMVTTAGSLAVAERAAPAGADAACLAGARAAGARLVGKVNLHELAYGTSGVNEHYGTPVNPLDPDLVPGGSSSGSAVVVADGEADVAYGTDTGGSIRVPAAFCGIAGLKTTHGRVPLAGVRPLAPSLDTVGPMARDVDGLVLGMGLLEPGFAADVDPAGAVCRLRLPGVEVDPAIDAAVDAALAAAELSVEEVVVPEWAPAYAAGTAVLDWEAARSCRDLTGDPGRRALLGATVRARLETAARVTRAQCDEAERFRPRWIELLGGLRRRAPLLALPTVGCFPPPKATSAARLFTPLTNPVNLAGLPAASVPVPTAGPLPAGLQLVGGPGEEALLLATARRLEVAVRR